MLTVPSSTALIVPLEIAKALFFVAYVASTIGVIIGVYWEGDQFPKEKQNRGWLLLIRSLAADTLFTVLIFGTDGWIGRIQRSEIIALENKLAARSLSDVQLAEMRQELGAFSGQQFLFDAYMVKETSDIGKQISDTLVSAGWIKSIQPPNAFLKSVVAGVSIFEDEQAPDRTKAAAAKLETLLDKDGIAAYEVSRNIPNDKAIIGIQVGIKP
jgi:hypothetical protein